VWGVGCGADGGEKRLQDGRRADTKGEGVWGGLGGGVGDWGAKAVFIQSLATSNKALQ